MSHAAPTPDTGSGLAAIAIVLTFAVLLQQFALISPPQFGTTPPWPTRGWTTALPEEQGIDSARLASALDEIRDKQLNIHSLLVVRNGQLVLDAVFYPYDGTTPHELASVTKSLTTSHRDSGQPDDTRHLAAAPQAGA